MGAERSSIENRDWLNSFHLSYRFLSNSISKTRFLFLLLSIGSLIYVYILLYICDIMARQISISNEVYARLSRIKGKRSFSEVINESLANMDVDPVPLSKEEINRIREALKDVEAGRVYTTAQVRRKLGI